MAEAKKAPAKKAAAKKAAAPQQSSNSESKDNLLRQAYGAATQRLREQHRDDFNKLYAEEAKQRGVEWTPKKSPEEKAREQLEALFAEHPHLREEYLAQQEQAGEQAEGDDTEVPERV